ncbi:uncharacterized protein J3D65DRAFT_112357 [Phyllosticta citribraziliensis]|uniref:Uncharacterized protein n=1 Tax=Phyllosticta citribraziliensis TaxID=989973 RepID=A0ABR1L803_9PEZI
MFMSLSAPIVAESKCIDQVQDEIHPVRDLQTYQSLRHGKLTTTCHYYVRVHVFRRRLLSPCWSASRGSHRTARRDSQARQTRQTRQTDGDRNMNKRASVLTLTYLGCASPHVGLYVGMTNPPLVVDRAHANNHAAAIVIHHHHHHKSTSTTRHDRSMKRQRLGDGDARRLGPSLSLAIHVQASMAAAGVMPRSRGHVIVQPRGLSFGGLCFTLIRSFARIRVLITRKFDPAIILRDCGARLRQRTNAKSENRFKRQAERQLGLVWSPPNQSSNKSRSSGDVLVQKDIDEMAYMPIVCHPLGAFV